MNNSSNTPSSTTPPPPPPLPPAYPPVIKNKTGGRFQLFTGAGFMGYIPEPPPAEVIPERDPFMAWVGPKISMLVWQQVLAFFEWSQKEFKSEVQVRLFVNHERRLWAAWAFPQKPNGMTTSEIGDHANYATQRAQFGRGWMLLGTIHHHCTSSAFQSGVDTANERNQDGVHITVGKVGLGEYDLHGRVVLRSTQFDINWEDWFEVPEPFRVYPQKLQSIVINHLLKQPPAADTLFPETWKTNCEKPAATVYQGWQGNSSSTYHGSSSSSSVSATESLDTNLRGQFTDPEFRFIEEVTRLCSRATTGHDRLDVLVHEIKPEIKSEIELLAAVYKESDTHGVAHKRAEELIDCWDFPVVIGEVDRIAKLKNKGLVVVK